MVGRFAPSRAEAQELARSSLQRRTQNLMPLGIGVIAGPISRTISDPDRRASAGRSLQGFARDVQTLPSLDYGRIANDTGQQISEGVRNLPRLAGEVVRNLPTIVRAATYGPIEDEELAQQRLELARMRGDASGARNAADAANANTALAAVNVGAPILAGPTPSLLRTSAVAAGATAPFAFSGSEPLQERIPRGIAQTTGAAVVAPAIQAGARGVLNQTSSANTALRRIRQELADAGMSRQATDDLVARLQDGDIAGASGVIAQEIPNTPMTRMPTLARQIGVDHEAAGRRLEQRFGPMTTGERGPSPDDLLLQTDYESGQGRPRRTLANFNDQRAPVIAANARDIATRGLDPVSLEGGGGTAAAHALRGVHAEMRALRRQLYAQADEMAESAGPISNNVGSNLVDRTTAMVDRLRLRRDPSHERWMREFEALGQDIADGRATWGDVHQVRTQLNEAWGAASPADRRVLSAFKRELDGFREQFAPPEYTRAVANADRYSKEMSQMFGRRAQVELGPDGEFVGNNDIAGSRMDALINTDMDTRSMARMFINENGLPSPAGTALARRLRQINDELRRTPGGEASTMDQSRQMRTPLSVRQGGRETVGSRGFGADRANPGRYGVEQPTPELQAVREMVIDELVLARLSARADGAPIPAQAISTRLRNALSERGGRQMMQELFTEAELAELADLQQYFERLTPGAGVARSGTPQGRDRRIMQTVRGAVARILSPVDRYATGGLAGRIADGWVEGMAEAHATQQARRMTAPPGRYTPRQPPNLARARQLSVAPGLAAGVVARSAWRDAEGGSLEAYSDQELERIAGSR